LFCATLLLVFLRHTIQGIKIDIYQAEDATLFSGATVTSEHIGFSGTGYADFTDRGTFGTFYIEASLNGEYRITLRYANGGADKRSMEVHIDQIKQGSSFELPPTGAWTNWREESITAYMSAGQHQIRIVASDEYGPNVDWMSVEGPLNSRSTVLEADQNLLKGQFRSSPGGLFKAGLDSDGQLVIQDRSSSTIIWSSQKSGGESVYMQHDGNLVIRDGKSLPT
jgi:hypothetical protein